MQRSASAQRRNKENKMRRNKSGSVNGPGCMDWLRSDELHQKVKEVPLGSAGQRCGGYERYFAMVETKLADPACSGDVVVAGLDDD